MITVRKPTAPANLFGLELDDRSAYVQLTVQGFTPMLLNHIDGAVCPVCTLSRVYCVAVTRKGVGGYMFRVCQDCGQAVKVFSSK